MQSHVREAWQRIRADAWPLAQRAAAAVIAWVIALGIGDHPQPFFAPIAAVIALNATLGERGVNAIRLLLGVVLGISVAEVTLLFSADSYVSLGLATFVAMAIARTFGGNGLVVAQAAAGAILTVAVADGQSGFNRIADALVGAGVALVFSQVLFSPDPMKLLHRAESNALRDMASGMRLTARALATDDDESGDRAMQKLRNLRDRLADLGKTRTASANVARRSLAWRSRVKPLVYERENAGQLDLLGGSCLLLTRTSLALRPADRQVIETAVDRVAELLAQLAASPGDQSVRQRAVDRIPDAIMVDEPDAPLDGALVTCLASLHLVAVDLMVFAGVDPAEAASAIAAGRSELQISTPPDRGRRFRLLSRLTRGIRNLAR
ncbi:aromatic acid exporter family protein [Rhodococcus sp. NPDC058521]|uniref:FUSC family protein n=1 Tax=Rhodococcus sp. NPDC058521 TaxID=3346536 RepID=UPI003648A473